MSVQKDALAAGQVFVDQYGSAFRLVPGHRAMIKPHWERALADAPPPWDTEEQIRQELHEIASRVRLGAKMLGIFGCRLDGQRILDIGCGRGEEAMYLAGLGAASVVGTDHQEPLCEGAEVSNPAERLLDTADQTRRLLLEHLGELGQSARFEEAKVSYANDDIASSSFGDASFDVVCSFRVLEHLAKPSQAFGEMFRVLRPGGFAYHEYNPFFGIDGGHSLATLDIPWGHVRLAERDVDRYLAQFRPRERVKAMEHYRRLLNRMTIADMEGVARDAGFEVLALVPRARTEDVLEITEELYRQARRVYPGITLNDLVCRMVRVVLRRP